MTQFYLKNIYPELEVPENIAEGYLTNGALSNMTCLDIPKSLEIGFFTCHFTGGPQFIELSTKNELRKEDHCFDYVNIVKLTVCHGQKSSQEWKYNATSNQLVHELSKKCLASNAAKKGVIVEPCNSNSTQQKWKFQYFYPEKIKNV